MGGVVSDVLDTVTDDVLGFDPGGGGIYDVGRDVLGDDIADDILGFDPNGGGIVPIANTAAKIAVAYAAGQGLSSLLSGATAGTTNALQQFASNIDPAVLETMSAEQVAAQAINSPYFALAQSNIDPAMLEGMSAQEVLLSPVINQSAVAGSFIDDLGNLVDSGGNIISKAISAGGDLLGTVGNVLGGLGGSAADTIGSLFSGPSGTANSLAALLASGALTQSDINRLKDLGSTAQQQYRGLAEEASAPVQFTPYGVTTSLFNTTPTAGGITSNLTGQGQQLSDAALQAALSSYQQAGTADLNQMAQERMGLYQQLVGPEQQRQRLATEARLAAQGRLGIGAGGGEYAPELKALEDAIAKQNLTFALQAPQEALAQRTALLQQGSSAAAIPTNLAGQQLQAGQLSGTLGQQAAGTAAQRGQLLGQYAGQGISEQLLANIAAAQISSERNKAIGQALQGALGTTSQTGGTTGTGGFNIGNLISTVGGLFGGGNSGLPYTGANLFENTAAVNTMLQRPPENIV